MSTLPLETRRQAAAKARSRADMRCSVGGGEGATRGWEVGVDLKGRGWDGLIGGKRSDGNGMRRGGPAEGRNSSNVPLLQAAHTTREYPASMIILQITRLLYGHYVPNHVLFMRGFVPTTNAVTNCDISWIWAKNCVPPVLPHHSVPYLLECLQPPRSGRQARRLSK